MKKRGTKIYTREMILARCQEVGDCLEWTGCMNNGSPVAKSGAIQQSVRRLMLEFSGVEIRTGYFVSAKCGNHRCVNPDHTVQRHTKAQMNVIARMPVKNPTLKSARISASKRVGAKLDMQAAREIRMSNKSHAELAKEHGISKETVRLILNGELWRELASPFSGLGQRG